MFGDILRELRRKNKLTQVDLSKILKVSAPTIALWETNKREPDMQMIKNIANYFKVSINYLFEYNEDLIKIENGNLYLTDENQSILNIFNHLNESNKIKAFSYISGLLVAQ